MLIDSEPVELANLLCQRMSRTYNRPMTVFRKRYGQWIADADSQNDADSQYTSCSHEFLQDWFEQVLLKADQASVKLLDQDQAWVGLAVPGCDSDCPVVIAGKITIKIESLISSAAERALDQVAIIERDLMLRDYADRLTASFEEQSFLRRLSRHLDYCVVNRSLDQVADTIMSQLRALMDVESVFLLVAEEPEEGQVSCRLEMGAASGYPAMNLEFWQNAIADCALFRPQTQVRNFNDNALEGDSGYRLRSYAITPVKKESKLFGWLVAVNKRPSVTVARSRLGEELGKNDLGTMEATLLEVAASMLASHATNHDRFKQIERLAVDIIHALIGVVEARDKYTCGHSHRVALVARRIASSLGLPVNECDDIYVAGLLHDLGKVGVRDEVLRKAGKLTEEEFNEIRQHPQIGAQLLESLTPIKRLLPGILHHHESMDGRGYPFGLKDEQIPLMARILAVADAWDAMTSDRPYRKGMSAEKAASILIEGQGQQWDTAAVQALLANIDEAKAICCEANQQLQQHQIGQIFGIASTQPPVSFTI
jgi:HD-GYP domain-containing protein (c-di-GMP phosphodiesterase class II)